MDYCKQSLKINTENSYTTCEPSPSNINFNFSCKAIFSNWILRQDSTIPEYMRLRSPPRIDKFIQFTLQEFLSDEQSRDETIDDILREWPVNNARRRKFIHYALKRAEEVVESKPDYHNIVHLEFYAIALHKHVFDERNIMNLIIQRSMRGNKDGMVPALESSIDSLEATILVDDHETCSICLEEFSVDGVSGVSECVCMPCKHHIFHGDCIKKWLKTSHYCPICRFAMPTQLDM